jgi:hypothetical protein
LTTYNGWLFAEYFDTPMFKKAEAALKADPDSNAEGRMTPGYSNWLTKYMRGVGVEPKGLSPHRFRDLWRARATASGLTDIQTEVLGGWSPSTMAASYGSGIKAEVSATAALIGRVDFSDILADLPAYRLP